MNIGTIQGGTNAGWRRVKPAHKPWQCVCGNPEGRTSRFKTNPGYLSRCSDCGTPRP